MKQVTGNNSQSNNAETSIQIYLNGFSVISQSGVTSFYNHHNFALLNTNITTIIWNTPQVCLVPTEFLCQQNLAQHILQAGFCVDQNTQLTNYTLHPQIAAVWNAPLHIINNVDALWPNAKHIHSLQAVINQTAENQLKIYVEQNIANIAICNNVALQNANTIPVNSNEDLLYYAITLCKQQPTQTTVDLTGDFNNDTIQLFQKYFHAVITNTPNPVLQTLHEIQ